MRPIGEVSQARTSRMLAKRGVTSPEATHPPPPRRRERGPPPPNPALAPPLPPDRLVLFMKLNRLGRWFVFVGLSIFICGRALMAAETDAAGLNQLTPAEKAA